MSKFMPNKDKKKCPNDETILIDEPKIVVDKDLVVAAENLVNKLQAMYKDPEFQATFLVASLYQNPYKGPSAISEMLILKEKLQQITGDNNA